MTMNGMQDSSKAALKRWRWSLIFLVGVPLVSGGLLLSQADLGQWSQWGQRRSPGLHGAYRYPFDQSLNRNRTPVLGLQQEMAVAQQQVQRYPESGLEQAVLAESYLKMARATGEESWFLLAEQTAEQSLVKLPFENRGARMVLARVAEAQHDFTMALKLAEQDLKPEEAASLRASSHLAMGQLTAAGQAAEEWVNLTLSPAAFTFQGVVAYAQGKSEQALQSFQYALELEEPDDLTQSARVRTLLGRFHYKRGQLEQAVALYREALHILPGYPPALLNLAQVEIRQDQLANAERRYAQLQSASANGPTIYTPLILRGQAQIYQLRGNSAAAASRWAEAEQLLRQGLDQPSSPFGHRRDLARLWLERSRPEDGQAAVDLMQAELKVRQDAATLETYAGTLAQTGQWEAAEQAIQKAIALGTQKAGTFHRASLIATQRGNTAQAQTYLNQAQALDPQFNQRAQQVADLGVGLGE